MRSDGDDLGRSDKVCKRLIVVVVVGWPQLSGFRKDAQKVVDQRTLITRAVKHGTPTDVDGGVCFVLAPAHTWCTARARCVGGCRSVTRRPPSRACAIGQVRHAKRGCPGTVQMVRHERADPLRDSRLGDRSVELRSFRPVEFREHPRHC